MEIKHNLYLMRMKEFDMSLAFEEQAMCRRGPELLSAPGLFIDGKMIIQQPAMPEIRFAAGQPAPVQKQHWVRRFGSCPMLFVR